jgi:hypothetical protein
MSHQLLANPARPFRVRHVDLLYACILTVGEADANEQWPFKFFPAISRVSSLDIKLRSPKVRGRSLLKGGTGETYLSPKQYLHVPDESQLPLAQRG